MNGKVIYLDIDGVLNSRRYDAERKTGQGNIDESRLCLLAGLVERTGAQIVLSSSWRKHWEPDQALCDETGRGLHAVFAKYGLRIGGKTPVKADNDRAAEIRAHLAAHPQITRFVIIDDEPFGWGTLAERLVKTDARIGRGLEERHLLRAEALLNGEEA